MDAYRYYSGCWVCYEGRGFLSFREWWGGEEWVWWGSGGF